MGGGAKRARGPAPAPPAKQQRQRDGKSDKILGRFLLKDVLALMTIVDDEMRRCDGSVLDVDAIAIPWAAIAGALAEQRPDLRWSARTCQAIWKYLAYEREPAAAEEEGDGGGDLDPDSDVEDFVLTGGGDEAAAAAAAAAPAERESIAVLRKQAAAMRAATADPTLPRHTVRVGAAPTAEPARVRVPLLHAQATVLLKTQLLRAPVDAAAPPSAHSAPQQFVDHAFRAMYCGRQAFPDFDGQLPQDADRFVAFLDDKYRALSERAAYAYFESSARQKHRSVAGAAARAAPASPKQGGVSRLVGGPAVPTLVAAAPASPSQVGGGGGSSV